MGGGGGSMYATTPPFFLPVTQNYHEATIFENVWPCKPFVADAPMKKKSRNLVIPPSQSTLKYSSENRPSSRGLIILKFGNRTGILFMLLQYWVMSLEGGWWYNRKTSLVLLKIKTNYMLSLNFCNNSNNT